MTTINPPIPLADPANQCRLDYIQEYASQLDIEYPQVCRPLEWILTVRFVNVIIYSHLELLRSPAHLQLARKFDLDSQH